MSFLNTVKIPLKPTFNRIYDLLNTLYDPTFECDEEEGKGSLCWYWNFEEETENWGEYSEAIEKVVKKWVSEYNKGHNDHYAINYKVNQELVEIEFSLNVEPSGLPVERDNDYTLPKN
jgi:hypothetical protein